MNSLVKALEDLLKVKLHKDISGKDAWYQENQPKAWQQAREALSLYSQSEGKTKEEILDGLNITTPLNELEGEEIYTRKEVLAAMEVYAQQFQSKENEGKQGDVFVKASERLPENPKPKQRVFIKNDGKRDVMVYIIDWESKEGNWCWSLAFNDSKGKRISKKEFEKIEWLDEETFDTSN